MARISGDTTVWSSVAEKKVLVVLERPGYALASMSTAKVD